MKKRRILLILIVLALCFTGCDTYGMFKKYPWERADQWYCKEIDFTIPFFRDDNGKLIASPPSKLTWNGQTYDVYVGFRGSSYHFLVTFEAENNEIYLSGTWEYRGEAMVFAVVEDLIFEGVFEKLVFVPQ